MRNSQYTLEMDAVESLIRAGEFAQARSSLSRKYTWKLLLPNERVRYASLTRRLNLPLLGLKLLNPVVRAERDQTNIPQATASEIAEYGALLIRVGGVSEALTLLKSLNPKENPEILLYESYALFSQWNYEAAIPLLESYRICEKLSEYERIVGEANLVAALVYERRENAGSELKKHLDETKRLGHQRLYLNALLTATEDCVHKKDWEGARKKLQIAKSLAPKAGELEELFTRKWIAIVAMYETQSKEARERMEEIKTHAQVLEHWETIRNCDYHTAVAYQDESVFLKVYFGSANLTYRRRLIADYGKTFNIPPNYSWRIGSGPETDLILDLEAVCGPDQREAIKEGDLVHRLLLLLSRDFYRPIRIAAIHHTLYPDEFYNPVSSPQRVHQAVHRLRRYFEQKGLSLYIKEVESSYKLDSELSCNIIVSQLSGKKIKKITLRLASLLNQKGFELSFTTKEARKTLSLSLWATIRLLRAGCREGIVQKIGRGSNTVYKFVQRETGEQECF